MDLSLVNLNGGRFISKLLFLISAITAPFTCSLYAHQSHIPTQYHEHEWVENFFNSGQEHDVDEVIDFLVAVRASILTKGNQPPTLHELAEYSLNFMASEGAEIDEETIEYVMERLVEKDFDYTSVTSQDIPIMLAKHKHKKKSKPPACQITSKQAFGFLKCIAGGLLVLVPYPPAKAVGAGLIINGLNDCLDDARRIGDENQRLKDMDEQRRRERQMEQSEYNY